MSISKTFAVERLKRSSTSFSRIFWLPHRQGDPLWLQLFHFLCLGPRAPASTQLKMLRNQKLLLLQKMGSGHRVSHSAVSFLWPPCYGHSDVGNRSAQRGRIWNCALTLSTDAPRCSQFTDVSDVFSTWRILQLTKYSRV